MRGIPEATPIRLTNEERAELEGLARSTKTEHRMRQRARIVLLPADGVKTRAIGRAVGCTTGTASNGGCATPRSGLRVLMRPAIAALSLSTGPRRTSASWRC